MRAALTYDIAIAPTEKVTDAFFEGSVPSPRCRDIPVAREFMTILGLMTHDDVYYGMLRSIEDRPDHSAGSAKPSQKQETAHTCRQTTANPLWPPGFSAAIFDFDDTLALTHDLWKQIGHLLEVRGINFYLRCWPLAPDAWLRAARAGHPSAWPQGHGRGDAR